MPSYDDVEVITAYEKNLPTEAFTQDGAGLDATMPVPAEHTKLEVSPRSRLAHLSLASFSLG